MNTVYVFLADGFEEIEAVTPIDTLRRAGVRVETVGIGGAAITGAHGITVVPDCSGEGFVLPEDAAMVVLPGGGLGTDNLLASPVVSTAVKEAAQRDLPVAAICAAPKVLHRAGLLMGRRTAAFPSVRGELTGALVSEAAVEVDGNIITGRSAGVALEFSHALMTKMAGKAKADEILAGLYPEK